jgi:hypothetical protein
MKHVSRDRGTRIAAPIRNSGGSLMHLTYDQLRRFTTEDDMSPDQTLDVPFSGFVNGVLIGVSLWGGIAWAVWSLAA